MFRITKSNLLPLGVFTSTWCQLRRRLLVQVKERVLVLSLQALLALCDLRFHVHDWIVPVLSILIWFICYCLSWVRISTACLGVRRLFGSGRCVVASIGVALIHSINLDFAWLLLTTVSYDVSMKSDLPSSCWLHLRFGGFHLLSGLTHSNQMRTYCTRLVRAIAKACWWRRLICSPSDSSFPLWLAFELDLKRRWFYWKVALRMWSIREGRRWYPRGRCCPG